MKTYYFPNSEHIDRIFGGVMPVCIDKEEVDRLYSDGDEWENIYSQVHEATDDEIAEYGVYDS